MMKKSNSWRIKKEKKKQPPKHIKFTEDVNPFELLEKSEILEEEKKSVSQVSLASVIQILGISIIGI